MSRFFVTNETRRATNLAEADIEARKAKLWHQCEVERVALLREQLALLREQLARAERSLAGAKHDAERAQQRVEDLISMTSEQFEDNLLAAEIHATTTGSVSAVYNGVRWTR